MEVTRTASYFDRRTPVVCIVAPQYFRATHPAIAGGSVRHVHVHTGAITPWPVFDNIVRLAAVLGDQGERPAAAALAAEARQLLTAWPDGAQAQWDRLYRLERRLSRPLRNVTGDSLTEREVTVLKLLQGTLSLRQIGQELYLSPNTVKTHARTAYRKLGVSSRQDAIARAHEIGVL